MMEKTPNLGMSDICWDWVYFEVWKQNQKINQDNKNLQAQDGIYTLKTWVRNTMQSGGCINYWDVPLQSVGYSVELPRQLRDGPHTITADHLTKYLVWPAEFNDGLRGML